MNKLTGSIFGLLLLISSQGLATPSVDIFGHKYNEKARTQVQTQVTCQDFSGQYRGTCDDNPGQVIDMQIHQIGCEDMIINNDLISIGSVSMNNTTSKYYTQALSHSLQWITGNALAFNMLGHWSYSFEQETYILPLAIRGQLLLSVDKLVYSGANYTCTYYR